MSDVLKSARVARTGEVSDVAAVPTPQRPRRSPPPAASESGLESRRAALAVILKALHHRGGLEQALTAPALLALESRDRGFARALVMTALRRKGGIDRIPQTRLAKPPAEEVTALIGLGIAQLLYLDTPAHAAVSTTMALADALNATRAFKPLINGVLRRVEREGAPALGAEVWAPDWLLARWRAAYGEEAALTIAAVIPEEPATDLTVKDPADAAALAQALDGEVLANGSVRTRRRRRGP